MIEKKGAILSIYSGQTLALKFDFDHVDRGKYGKCEAKMYEDVKFMLFPGMDGDALSGYYLETPTPIEGR